jgi:hypothetical protein
MVVYCPNCEMRSEELERGQRRCEHCGETASAHESSPAAPVIDKDAVTPTPVLSIPLWAWVFVASCGLIPFFTFGAIPGFIGVGGAGGCISIARSDSLSTLAKMVACSALTATCWGAVIVLVGAQVVQARR